MSTYMSIIIWSVYFIIAIWDLRDNKIPNKLLLLLLCVSFVNNLYYSVSYVHFLEYFYAGMIFFLGGLLLYFIHAMAPGDVKMLGVVGFSVGLDNLSSVAYWIGVSTVIIGLLYGLFSMSDRLNSVSDMYHRYKLILLSANSISGGAEHYSNKLRMPFAPVVVIGLALHSYF
ncbi:A24 family peptidase [Vibrio cortegadensis]|uniref:prepilin peptidase n=1 Tax=Vibrio cortegadensis TaxID=1328770 RepID=UPI0021C37F9E|nr:A24 family peptidase [Vibrio cortegadensis]MDN3698942.1 A24 family peptidase [Vibrio cortegadensis]